MLPNSHFDQCLAGYFPTHPHREIFGGLQGINLSDQGNYSPYQGIRILSNSGSYRASKNAISRLYGPENRSFSRCDCLAISHAKDLNTIVFVRRFASRRSNLPSIKKSRRNHRHYKPSRKFHIRQMLTLPERTPQFTVMRAAWSSTIERVNLDRFYIYLCAQVNLLSNWSSPLPNLWLRSVRGVLAGRAFRGNRRANPGVDRSGRRSWGADNAVGVEYRRHWQRRATRPRRAR